jgi:phospholipase C
MVSVRRIAFCFAFVGMVGLSACGGGLATSPSVDPQSFKLQRMLGSSKIQHVVIVVQENRSFNNLFMDYPGATTQDFGYTTTGKKVKLQPVGLEAPYDMGHDLDVFFNECNGTGSIPGTNCQMNGFNKDPATCGDHCPLKYPAYAYVPLHETKPYWDMAKQYVLADQMYPSNLDESSFISHQYIIAAQAMQASGFPTSDEWGCEGPPGDEVGILSQQRKFPDGGESVCFTDTSLGQEADAAGVSWAFYSAPIGPKGAGGWNGYQANQYVYNSPDWKNDYITPPTQFLKDVSKGKLRQISWITPTTLNSDHAGYRSNTGPAWVASIVNAVGESQYWDSTAIFIIWDDPGGFFDPEPPAYIDYDGFGIRIPMLIVSAYAKKGHVSHVQYEHGSILRFAEDVFGLGRLSASDARATSPAEDSFDFKKPPRAFKPIASSLSKEYFLRQPQTSGPPDTDL